MFKKLIKFFIILSSIFLIGVTIESQNIKGYLFIENDIGETDILAREKVERVLLDKNFKEVKIQGVPYMNGEIYVGLPEGEYYLKSTIENHKKKILTKIEKNEKYKSIKINYGICETLKTDRKIFTMVTFIVGMVNLIFFYNLRKEIKNTPGYTGIFFLIFIKILFSNGVSITDKNLLFLNAVLSSVIGLLLLYYFFKNKNIKLNLAYFSLIMLYGIIDLYFLGIISSEKIFTFIYAQNLSINKWLTIIFTYVDFTFILFIIILVESLRREVSETLIKNKRIRELLIIIFLIISLLTGFLAHKTRLYLYINLYNYMFAYWLTLFFQIKNFSRNLNYVLRMFMYLLMFYIFFYYTNDIRLILIFVGSFTGVNIIAYLFTGMIRTDSKYIEKVENRFVLVDNLEEFKYQVKKELEKTLFLQKIKVLVFFEKNGYEKYLRNSLLIDDLIIFSKDFLNENLEYDSIIKLSYGKNRCVGLILIKNKRGKLLYEEEKYLIEFSKIVSKVASRIRLNKLQEELRCTK